MNWNRDMKLGWRLAAVTFLAAWMLGGIWAPQALDRSAAAAEIGFIEDFALAKDREAVLKQLIPGTEDYYYYHALHYQNTEQFDKVDEILEAWIKRYKYTPRVYEIRNRQALLTYDTNPQASLAYLRQQLGLRFDHQREVVNRKPNLPTKLNPSLISQQTLTQQALGRYKNLQGFEDRALDWLAATDLNADRRRALLSRLKRPDVASLPKLVVADLAHQYSRGFGSLPIHSQLLLAQLDECLKLQPALLNQTNFVNVYLSKLRPISEVDWKYDRQAHAAYLDRLWAFVARLAPVHNSLKAHVLYHQLVLDRADGQYNRERFMSYIKLPRNVSYMNSDYLKLEANRRYPANLQANFSGQTLLSPVGNDEPLVRSYLHHFFKTDASYKAYEPYLNDLYLKHNFAETKIVNGLGEGEQWYSMLPPAKYQQLKARVDLDFAYTNRKQFGPQDAVSLDVDVKNVKTLIVKVYEINTATYYRQQGRPVDTDLNLDGLVPNDEKTFQYGEPPLLRVRRHFEFPQLNRRGVYVIDFIGNGKNSRALVHKGQLRYNTRETTAGQVFRVRDEKNQQLPQATLWLAGREYRPDKAGEITVPFSNKPGRHPIVLSHDGFNTLDFFAQRAENYQLAAEFYVDRESLLKRKTSTVVVRPVLQLNGLPVTLAVLEDVRLEITSTNIDGIASSKQVADFKLFEDRESTYEFQVPPRLAKVQFRLLAKLKNLSQNKQLNLAAAQAFSLNEIVRTDKLEDLFLSCIDGNYVVDVLGRTGEAWGDRPVQLAIKHRDFKHPVNVTLKSGEQGRLVLGPLTDISWLKATSPSGSEHTWRPQRDRHTYHTVVNSASGDVIEIPYMGSQDQPKRAELSLLETRGATFVEDRFAALAIKSGLVNVQGLPPGDYDLELKDSQTRIRLHVTAGVKRDGYVLGQSRFLEVRNPRPLQIKSVDTDDKLVKVALVNASPFARVHVVATRYQPAYDIFSSLSRVRDPNPTGVKQPVLPSAYVAGRNIGDEYRYIIDRQYAAKFPGNMLARPSLLLNPWVLRSTDTREQLPEAGEDLIRAHGGDKRTEEPRSGGPQVTLKEDSYSSLGFLSQPSVVLANLEADKNGVVQIDRGHLGPHQQLHIVAMDPANTAYRFVSLGAKPTEFLDLRLAKSLDPKIHFTQQKQVSVVRSDTTFKLPDITSSKFEAYDSLPRVYTLYATLSGDAKLAEFSFAVRWPTLTDEQKREQYSKYACHELSFFLFKKDKAFFDAVVLPYLANKKDKTFMDLWLLGQDVSGFLQPWSYEQLNTVERILLSQQIAGEQAQTSRFIKDAYDLKPLDLNRRVRLFDTAVLGRTLDVGDDLGLESALKRLVPGEKHAELPGRAPNAPKPTGQAAANMPNNDNDAQVDKVEQQLAQRMRQGDQKGGQGKSRSKSSGKQNGERRMAELAKKTQDGKDRAFYRYDNRKRDALRQYYRQMDPTKEWVENNYYQLPIAAQNSELVTPGGLWLDYAYHDPAKPFYSVQLAGATRNFTEMMFALAVLDLPFEAKEHKTKFADAEMTLEAASPMVVFHQEVQPAKGQLKETPILVSQNFFRHNDRYHMVDNRRVDKYVSEEFLVNVVYGCQIVVTNPTSAQQTLDVLLQVPEGAIPVSGGRYTKTVSIDLAAYNTNRIEYYFYFPEAGQYPDYPVQVSRNEQIVAFAEPETLKVVTKPSQIDRESWDYISQNGSAAEVLSFLKHQNLQRIKLDRIAFRMRDGEFFQAATALLARRHVYNQTIWSYGIQHNSVPQIREFLAHANQFVTKCGTALASELLVIDPVVRKTYQHKDYRPLVNARAHRLGRRRQIVNPQLYAQYHELLKIASYRRELDAGDRMAVTYYLLLQDRVEEAMAMFEAVDPKRLKTQMQYDYFTAYMNFYRSEPDLAKGVVAKYEEYPVDRWRNAFASIEQQIKEIDGGSVEVVDSEDQAAIQTAMAASEPSFDFVVESRQIKLNYQNLRRVQVNYYLMDIELLFSRNPFVQQYSGQFSYILPNLTEQVELPAKKSKLTVDLPEELHNANVLVEIVGDGKTQSAAYYSNALSVQVTENYGQLRVADRTVARPMSKVYVKVYARLADGRVRFYKDGYTDLRGRFDYSSLNTGEINQVERFSILVLSDSHGAVVREANPPKQ